MSEEILKIELQELLRTVRFKRDNGTILEASSMESIRQCCSELRPEIGAAADVLFEFVNAADRIAGQEFPITLEFAITVN